MNFTKNLAIYNEICYNMVSKRKKETYYELNKTSNKETYQRELNSKV